jgi:23S rRNA (adenine2030-N6)-methyltransferase
MAAIPCGGRLSQGIERIEALMNYQHHFHAGNHADVLKHLVLCQLIELMQQKPGGFLMLDTHAGAGLYDLTADEARRGDEARGGIERLRAAVAVDRGAKAAAVPALITDYLTRLEAAGRANYPGSPVLAVGQLRAQDRFIGVELVAKVARELDRHLAACPRRADGVLARRVVARCGEGLAALKSDLPPIERRGLILIDPPYEQGSERDEIIAALTAGLQRFEHGVFALWYPIKQRPFLRRWLNRIARLTDRPVLTIENSLVPDELGNRLTGSGLLIINPPWPLDVVIRPALTYINVALREDTAAPCAITWLNPPK